MGITAVPQFAIVEIGEGRDGLARGDQPVQAVEDLLFDTAALVARLDLVPVDPGPVDPAVVVGLVRADGRGVQRSS